ncbi:hypothetical protein [uncultured Croceitalea sp.]|uniref:hypothetical protein n=1 Tax=uncultured Croceitalea sp. TaxID=1798908 RepID=UPI00330564DA
MKTSTLVTIYRLENLLNTQKENKDLFRLHQLLHINLIKWCYNSSDVLIDYDKKRIFMNIILDNTDKRNQKCKTAKAVMPTNLRYDNLTSFLKSCILEDDASIEFYKSQMTVFRSLKIIPEKTVKLEESIKQ